MGSIERDTFHRFARLRRRCVGRPHDQGVGARKRPQCGAVLIAKRPDCSSAQLPPHLLRPGRIAWQRLGQGGADSRRKRVARAAHMPDQGQQEQCRRDKGRYRVAR